MNDDLKPRVITIEIEDGKEEFRIDENMDTMLQFLAKYVKESTIHALDQMGVLTRSVDDLDFLLTTELTVNRIPTIDIDKEFWKSIKQAASESKWMPEEYFMNDWVSDVCEYLRNGDGGGI
jgi:hypothetical protein